MENLVFNTTKEIKEYTSRINLKGRSKVGSYIELLSTLKKVEENSRRDNLMSVNRRLNNLKAKYNQKLTKLPSITENPLKGLGYKRSSISDLTLEDLNIPSNHICLVALRRKGGYFSYESNISSEANVIVIEFEQQRDSLLNEFKQFKTKQEIEVIEKQKEVELQKIEQRKNELKELYGLGDTEALLKDFLANEVHPAPDYIYQIKRESGLSWKKLREIYR